MDDKPKAVDLEKIRETLINEKGLSERECEVFFMVGSGVNNREAANQMFVTEGTVKFHLTSIFKKLGIKNRSKLVLLAHGIDAL